MTFRLISTLTLVPEGFSHVELSRRELLAGPVALLSEDTDQLLEIYSEYVHRISGILIMPADTLQIVELTQRLWRAQVPQSCFADLAQWLTPLLCALQQCMDTEDRIKVTERLLQRSERSLAGTTQDYQRVNQRLLNKVNDLTLAKEEIVDLNHVLESRVKERTADLEESLRQINQAQQQLVQAEKLAALGSMVAGLAHEINTPLGNCVLAASNLEETVDELLDSVQAGVIKKKEFLDHMDQLKSGFELLTINLSRSADLVGRFKQVAVDQSNEEQRVFKFSEMLADTIAAMSPRLKRAKCTVAVSCEETIILDSYPGDYSQILMNLIMNSLNHGFNGNPGGKINIDVTLIEEARQERLLQLDYKDNGSGLSEDSLARLFEPFFTTNREHGGTGLGMPIVHSLITQRLGGTIQLESGIGEGIHFVICTPVIAS
ncbi:sensor histidine kinase [Motiliproteus sp. MSK22-1]|uniref:sensor histidine kinase n=1 Tax=Motiliproteus sp. MSK22-1 TaxID=1897630 RepID=UPI000978B95D|nr:HAMP domain-containing sensor histidine kinase [Motiliproteus sp. MSK22-1]OMH39554.1 hypothetical protein BGP75_02900 [Motiliproteus sp. MSK22-1]